MKFGVREICDVVLRAKDKVKIGNQTFEKDEPVIYFDTAKTSTVEGAATTVYATGGKGNSRLIAWEGERTVTFTMEDALLSPLGFAILSGAGIVEAGADGAAINVHSTTTTIGTESSGSIEIDLSEALPTNGTLSTDADVYGFILDGTGSISKKLGKVTPSGSTVTFSVGSLGLSPGSSHTILLDYYVKMTSGVQQIEITPDKFAGSYYLEASTLFRRQDNGSDMPAQFVIPNVKIQSAFTFSMAASGDPSTFTFTMDAFPDYTKFDKSKKVLFALQIVDDFQAKGLRSARVMEEPVARGYKK